MRIPANLDSGGTTLMDFPTRQRSDPRYVVFYFTVAFVTTVAVGLTILFIVFRTPGAPAQSAERAGTELP